MSNTPRTDAQQLAAEEAFDVAGLVPAPFARELELESAAKDIQIDELSRLANEHLESFRTEYDKNSSLQADAEKWRAYQKRKQEVINAGMGRNPLR